MRPKESQLCLSSLKENTKFECPIIYLSNGGQQDYVWDFYKQGVIDQLILNKENEGLGFGTTDLFKICKTEYAIYVQNDQFLGRKYTEGELDKQIEVLDTRTEGTIVKSIGLAGDVCGDGSYSERGHLVNVDFYNSIPNKPFGGAGPYSHLPWIEGHIQDFYKESGYQHYIWKNQLIGDNGAWSIRTNPDKSIWRHRCDKKTTFLIQGPVKEAYVYPPFNEDQWKKIILEQKCNGEIPDGWKDNCFTVWR